MNSIDMVILSQGVSKSITGVQENTEVVLDIWYSHSTSTINNGPVSRMKWVGQLGG
jgi:hypothetical protein